jgi:hypothetical protein
MMTPDPKTAASTAGARLLKGTAISCAAAFMVGGLALGQATAFEGQLSVEDIPEERVYSPYAGRNYPDRVLFGDMHFHTNLSFDAGLIGTRLTPSDGYRFARGEEVISNTGQSVQLIRPLDFLVITDHAEMIGLAPAIESADPLLLDDPWGREIYEQYNSGLEGRQEAFAEIIDMATIRGINPFGSPALSRSIWSEFIEIAEQYNDPGTFTAMTGFEWSFSPQGDNLHRVVLFADGIDKTSQTLPLPFFDAPEPQLLWDYMEAYEAETGGRVLAISHNGNLSNGLMFPETKFDGSPIDADYAARRMRWEPLHEVTQVKGDEETHPLLSPEDEFADFEIWDVSNLAGTVAKTPEMLKREYVRSALRNGLRMQQELGVNPYQFGMTGSTDSHTALSTTRQENFFGKYPATEPSPDRHDHEVIPAADPALRIISAQESAAGLTGVWAQENTRKAIFDAFQRKEVFATTGTRMRVRFFGGWAFTAEDMATADFVSKGYRNGVPMGGDLRNAPEGGAPSFMVRALRDPDGANLDRIQIIKGWVDADGESYERIYDLAVSDGRTIGADGRALEPVGNTVDIETATFTNSIGAAALQSYWVDPDFDPAQGAFYYVRVLEIPTPRWTTYDAAFYDVPLPKVVPPTLQQRAYTSPIWYMPKG